MASKATPHSTLSPFELKNDLIALAQAKVSQQELKSDQTMLNAGRGNPNWIATEPREAFFALGEFALAECRRTWNEANVHLAGMPQKEAISGRFRAWLRASGSKPGINLLQRSLAYCIDELEFDADALIHELVDSIIGDNYPVPDRMLVHVEQIVHRFIQREMFDDQPPKGKFDIFAVEGGTAAMCYTFNSLFENGLLKKGDTIALGTPVFTPYVEFPHLNNFQLKTIELSQSEVAEDGRHIWQYPESEIKKLENPKIKAFFLVNPSNPPSFAVRQSTIDRIVRLVKTKRPDLIILTDDVYGTFVPGFRSLAAELPQNTILVYSYSKHFGCTGWRLGIVAVHEKNIFDDLIAKLPAKTKSQLAHRYGSLTPTPHKIKFIDRMVADSRCVALNHTAGLSLPQQVQMALFSLFALLDANDAYKHRCQEICHNRLKGLYRGLGLELVNDPLCASYYRQLDLAVWAERVVGKDFAEYVYTHRDPLDIVFNLARNYGTVLLNGSGFAGPPWSVRVSLANLNDDDYPQIGKNLATLCQNALEKWNKERRGGTVNGKVKGKSSARSTRKRKVPVGA
jgi:aspartate 4-decarboxylase